jgi:hypothetical protein
MSPWASGEDADCIIVVMVARSAGLYVTAPKRSVRHVLRLLVANVEAAGCPNRLCRPAEMSNAGTHLLYEGGAR